MVSASSSDASRTTTDAGHDNHDSDDEPTIGISRQEPDRVVVREGDGSESGERRQNIDGVIPGVGDESGASDLAAHTELHRRHDAAQSDRGHERGSGTRARRHVRRPDGVQRLIADETAARGEDDADDERREGLESSMAVRMVFVGRPRRDAYANQDDARREDVAGELESGRHDRRGVRQKADDDIAAGEKAADGHARECDTARGPVRLIGQCHCGIVSRRAWLREHAKKRLRY